MLDYRIDTFLTLCKERNYSKTARILNITQPAVTQHIQYLERSYGTKLFVHENKQLLLTKQGKILEKMAMGLSASDKRVFELIQESKTMRKTLKFGASLTIGEFVMPTIIRDLILIYPEVQVSMMVDNTDKLLSKLQAGNLDCIFVEGTFNKEDYEYYLFSNEDFVAVAGKEYEGEYQLEDLLGETLLCREVGSGTREILENLLKDKNLKIESFQNVVEIGNVNGIKQLVKEKMGISFMYKAAVKKELEEGTLYEIPMNFKIKREFNYVLLKNHMFVEDYINFYYYAKCIHEHGYYIEGTRE